VTRSSRRTAGLGCAAVGAAALLVALVGAGTWSDASPVTPAPTDRTPAVGSPGGPATASGTFPGDLSRGGTVLAERVGLEAPVSAVALQGQDLEVPADPRQVGWWSAGAAPGSAAGTVVLDGHVDYAGVTGALSVVPELRRGDEVALEVGSTTFRYTVQSVQRYAKVTGLPDTLFDLDGPPALVLITCGGTFDHTRGEYADNVVAYAVPAAP
jgi:hypothetical protein